MNESAIALRLSDVSKNYGPIKALSEVSLAVKRGRVHALLGENGAGKSTTVKLLSGLIAPTKGTIEIFDQQTRLTSPRIAQAVGIQTAFQEMTLLPDLSVFDNMMLPYSATNRTGMLRRGALRQQLEQHFDELGFPISLDLPVNRFNLALQQKLEIARALFRQPQILLLDEPTSTLTASDVNWLGDIIGKLKAGGVTIIFISHRMKEVREFCDDLSILRNGHHVATRPADAFSDTEVVESIVGRSISQVYPKKRLPLTAESVLTLKNVHTSRLNNINIDLKKGEILGVAALQGMGQLDLFQICFGIEQPDSGTLLLDGQPLTLLSPVDAIRPNVGIGFVPEDRKTEGLLLNQSGLKNTSLPVLSRFTVYGALNEKNEAQSAAKVFTRIELDRRALWMDAASFSGGNQQKIVIAKWLLARSRILLLFDPTRGIDVGTKHELYELIADFAAMGGSVLFYSTEIPEVVNLSHRVHVMYKGEIRETLVGNDIGETRVMDIAMGNLRQTGAH